MVLMVDLEVVEVERQVVVVQEILHLLVLPKVKMAAAVAVVAVVVVAVAALVQ